MSKLWIVGYDFSNCADHALETAALELQDAGGTLVLVQAFASPDRTVAHELLRASPAFSSLEQAYDAILAAARVKLQEVVDKLAIRFPTIAFQMRLEQGYPAACLTEIADELDAGCIVMGTHGRRGLEKFFVGSVTERVLRMTTRPVLVVRGPSDDDDED